MLNTFRIVLAATIGLAAVVVSIEAQAAPVGVGSSSDAGDVLTGPPTDEWRWTVGGGGGIGPDYEGSDNYKGFVFPFVRAAKGPLYGEIAPGRFGLNLLTNLIPDPNWRFGPLAAIRPGQRDVENKRVNKMHQGDSTAFELGASGGYDFNLDDRSRVGLTLYFSQDVSGVHDGFQIVPEVDYTLGFGEAKSWRFRTAASGSFASDGYMTEYFGVDRSDARRSGLDQYDADESVKDAEIRVGLGYSITENWIVNGTVVYRRMFGDAKDSPLVDDVGDPNQLTGALSVAYSW